MHETETETGTETGTGMVVGGMVSEVQEAWAAAGAASSIAVGGSSKGGLCRAAVRRLAASSLPLSRQPWV